MVQQCYNHLLAAVVNGGPYLLTEIGETLAIHHLLQVSDLKKRDQIQ